jgi:hypothetical protein
MQEEKPAEAQKAWQQAYGLGNLTGKYNLILILGKRGNKKLIYAEELRKLADKEEFYLANYETGNIFRKKIKFTEEKIAEEVFNFEKDLGLKENNNNNIANKISKKNFDNNFYSKKLSNVKETAIETKNKNESEKNLMLNNNANLINALYYYNKAAEQGLNKSIKKLSRLQLKSVVNSGFRNYKSEVFNLQKAKRKIDLLDFLEIIKNSAELKQLYFPCKSTNKTNESLYTGIFKIWKYLFGGDNGNLKEEEENKNFEISKNCLFV